MPGTRVRSEIDTSESVPALNDRNTLLCIIEGTDRMTENHPGDPLHNGKFGFAFNRMQLSLIDRGRPQGRFMYNIGAYTLRGIAEWMTKNDAFREIVVAVYYNQYYCGTEAVTNTGAGNSAVQTGFAVASEAASATLSAKGTSPS